MYSITEGFSPILYCRPDVVTSGNPFDTMKRFQGCVESSTTHGVLEYSTRVCTRLNILIA